MKNGILLFAILIITIVIMTIYDIQLRPGTVAPVPPGQAATALYVCPADSAFDKSSLVWQQMTQPVNIALLSFLMLTLMIYAWKTYVAMLTGPGGVLSDKAYEIPSMMLKILILAFIVSRLLTNTPNYYRAVNVRGINALFVLCESTSVGARAVRADSLSAAPNIVR